ncbi:hypothetical protein HPB47_019754 [Ixodes persulcatus]|uniref:Uncharacterized protein n=1 Tax=Ixodes persulcatus TaxID=34615 RepID=A0AC60QHD0_IXOPE|nr:hypothetical protein HPB47_019754 [Ixodes persulcatus]
MAASTTSPPMASASEAQEMGGALAGRCADVASECSELPIKESVAAKAHEKAKKCLMRPQLTVKKAKHCLSNYLQQHWQHHTGCSRYRGV